jgi:hypothetical protein
MTTSDPTPLLLAYQHPWVFIFKAPHPLDKYQHLDHPTRNSSTQLLILTPFSPWLMDQFRFNSARCLDFLLFSILDISLCHDITSIHEENELAAVAGARQDSFTLPFDGYSS